jgi:hypothetical protein
LRERISQTIVDVVGKIRSSCPTDLGVHKPSSNGREETLVYMQCSPPTSTQPFIRIHEDIYPLLRNNISVEGSEALGIGYRVTALLIVIAVFNFSFTKGGFVNFAW